MGWGGVGWGWGGVGCPAACASQCKGAGRLCVKWLLLSLFPPEQCASCMYGVFQHHSRSRSHRRSHRGHAPSVPGGGGVYSTLCDDVTHAQLRAHTHTHTHTHTRKHGRTHVTCMYAHECALTCTLHLRCMLAAHGPPRTQSWMHRSLQRGEGAGCDCTRTVQRMQACWSTLGPCCSWLQPTIQHPPCNQVLSLRRGCVPMHRALPPRTAPGPTSLPLWPEEAFGVPSGRESLRACAAACLIAHR